MHTHTYIHVHAHRQRVGLSQISDLAEKTCVHTHTYTYTHIDKGGLSRISSQVPVSDLGELRHICHFFRWQTMPRVSFVTFLARTQNVTRSIWQTMQQCKEECDALAHENIFCNLWRFLSHPSRKTSHFGTAGTKLFWSGRNVTIRLKLKNAFLFPSQISHISRKREAGRPFGLGPTLNTMHSVRCLLFHLFGCPDLVLRTRFGSWPDKKGHICTPSARTKKERDTPFE